MFWSFFFKKLRKGEAVALGHKMRSLWGHPLYLIADWWHFFVADLTHFKRHIMALSRSKSSSSSLVAWEFLILFRLQKTSVMPPYFYRVNDGMYLRKAWLASGVVAAHTSLVTPVGRLVWRSAHGFEGRRDWYLQLTSAYQSSLADEICISQVSHKRSGGCMWKYLNAHCLPLLLHCWMFASSSLWGIYCPPFLTELGFYSTMLLNVCSAKLGQGLRFSCASTNSVLDLTRQSLTCRQPCSPKPVLMLKI